MHRDVLSSAWCVYRDVLSSGMCIGTCSILGCVHRVVDIMVADIHLHFSLLYACVPYVCVCMFMCVCVCVSVCVRVRV